MLPEVRDACERDDAHLASCGYDTQTGFCEHVARVDSVTMISAYDCFANAPCDETSADCYPPENDELGEAICERVEDICDHYTCATDWRGIIAANHGWWRDTTAGAALACLDESSCRNVRHCLTAWSKAALGDFWPVHPWVSR